MRQNLGDKKHMWMPTTLLQLQCNHRGKHGEGESDHTKEKGRKNKMRIRITIIINQYVIK